MAKKRIKVTERKLGRSGALGLYYSDGRMEIDPRQNPKEYFSTILHELLHASFPDLSEEVVLKAEEIFIKTLWQQGYRKVSQ